MKAKKFMLHLLIETTEINFKCTYSFYTVCHFFTSKDHNYCKLKYSKTFCSSETLIIVLLDNIIIIIIKNLEQRLTDGQSKVLFSK